MGQKASDRSTVPLCAKHHRTGDDSYHNLGPRRFSEAHGVDLAAVVARLNLRPRIRVAAGWYIASIEGLEFPLADARAGLNTAMRLIPQVAAESLAAYMRQARHEQRGQR
jgi:hypothetical protein